MEDLSFRIFLKFLKMEESSLVVKINQSIQNRVSIICDACRHEGNRFLFLKLLNIKNWGGVWGGPPPSIILMQI